MARGFERNGNTLYVVCGFCSFLSACPVSALSATLGAKESIRIGILLPMSGEWTAGRTIAGATSLAVERINRDARLLGGRTVEFTWLDGACNASQSLAAMTELLTDAQLGAIIGPGAHLLRLALRTVSPSRALFSSRFRCLAFSKIVSRLFRLRYSLRSHGGLLLCSPLVVGRCAFCGLL
jgi:hypothetical protein